MRIVELFGPPGVGKSTLAKHVTHRPRGLPTSGLVPSGRYQAAYQVLQDQVTPRLRMRLAFTGRLLAAVEQIAATPGVGSWLLEEGSAQRAHVLAVLSVPLETRRAYVEALPVAALTLCLCLADAETIVGRGARRGRPGLLPSQAPASIEACLWTAGLLEHRGASVHRFNMMVPIAENASRLADVLHA